MTRITDYDIHNRLKWSSISQLLQEAAAHHAEALGWGFELLRTKKQFWVLGRIRMECKKPIASKSTISTQTWPKGTNGRWALRDFILGEDEEIALATSAWALLDMEKRQPQNLDEMGELMFKRQHIHAIEEFPEKLDFKGELSKISEWNIAYEELDLNNHVNNAIAVQRVMAFIPAEWWKKGWPEKLAIDYLAEITPDQSYEVFGHFEDESASVEVRTGQRAALRLELKRP